MRPSQVDAAIGAYRAAAELHPWQVRRCCRAAPRDPTSMPRAALVLWQASAMLDLAELLMRRGANSTNVNRVDDGGVAGACDLAAAAAMLEPGARSEEAVREHCGAAAAGASAAAVTADTRGGGACAMLVPFPALAAHSKVDDDGACLVTLPAGNTRLGGPPGQQRAQPAQGVIVPRGASLRVVGARGAVGSILDAAGVGRHFLVASGSLTLEKVRLEYYCTAAHRGTPVSRAHASSQVVLENGRALLSSGGAVLLLHNATLRAKETGFVRNRAALGSAGAVMCRAAAYVNLDDVLFANNAATLRGGAIAIDVPPGGPPTELRLHGLRWMNNHAQRGGDDAQVCGADVGLAGARAVGCDGGSASSDVEEGAGGALFGGAMLTAVESQLEGLEALDVKGLEPAALNLLRRARAADPASPNALGALASMLYNHARDDEARAELGEFEKHHGPHPTADSVRVMLEHKSAAALAQRALRLNGQVARMRQGRDVAVAFASRHDAQDAAIESFARAIALDPQNGDTWDSASASLFFAGELADSALMAAAGAEIAPSHAGLEAEAAKARAYPAPRPNAESIASAAAAAATAQFGDAKFRRVDMPEGSFAESAESVDIQAHAEVFGAAPAVFVSHEPLVSPVRPLAATPTKSGERAHSARSARRRRAPR